MQYLPYLTILGSVIAFSFGVWKYFDARKLEAENTKFEQFRKTFVWFAGRNDESGNILTAVQQAVAVYQLTQFPEYKHMSLPIIEHLINETAGEEPPSLFRKALLEVHADLDR